MTQKFGFTYFSSPEYLTNMRLDQWIKLISDVGASSIIFNANFKVAIPEDAFIISLENGLEPIVHFKAQLPTTRLFNESALLLDIYKKRGVKTVIFGDQPNLKKAWQIPNWQFEDLVEHFLNCFVPLANHAILMDQTPISAPLFPGGDYWDIAFLELFFEGLKKRQVQEIIDKIALASYGFTFNKSLAWGEGGPERWPGVKPYQVRPGYENQIGFHNYEWAQAISQRNFGYKLPIIILDAGNSGFTEVNKNEKSTLQTIKELLTAIVTPGDKNATSLSASTSANNRVIGINFDLETIKTLAGSSFSTEFFKKLFPPRTANEQNLSKTTNENKFIGHYLLLPTYTSGVPDNVLDKVRPFIKAFLPTVGFSLEEALCASKVSVYPDPFLFSDEKINQLRSSGCYVEILPDYGIDIATLIQRH